MEPISFNEIEVFKGKTLSDVFKDIYKNTKDKDSQINTLIQQLSPLITNISDAIQLIPLIKDYLETGVKNNEHLVKMAAVIQRAMNTKSPNSMTGDSDDYIIPQHEKDELLKQAAELKKSSEEITSINLTNPPIINNVSGSA